MTTSFVRIVGGLMDIWLDIAPGSGILVNKSVEFHVVPKRVKKISIVNLVL